MKGLNNVVVMKLNRAMPFYYQDNDSFFGVNNKTSTRFDHNFSITDFIKINLGTEVALPLVSDIYWWC